MKQSSKRISSDRGGRLIITMIVWNLARAIFKIEFTLVEISIVYLVIEHILYSPYEYKLKGDQ